MTESRMASTVWHDRLALLAAGGLIVLAFAATPARAGDGDPRRGQVVDAETSAPLAGVHVLAVWSRRPEHMLPGLGRLGFHSLSEAVTDANGRFTIPPRVVPNLPLFHRIEGPALTFFKAGYGGWREREDVIEMQPLRTRAAEVAYLEGRTRQRDAERKGWRDADRPAHLPDVPYARLARYEAGVNAARAAVGLAPVGLGFPYLRDEPRPSGPPPDARDLRGPSGVALDAAGHVYVADTNNHRVVKLSPALEPVATWGRFGRGDGEFQYPHGIAVAPDGTIHVADWGNGRIQRFTADGCLLDKWGRLRPGDFGDHFSPRDVAITRDSEVIVFADHAVYRFTAAGRRLGVWGAAYQFASRAGIAVGADGRVYTITGRWDSTVPPIAVYDRHGRRLAAWGEWGATPQQRSPGQLFDPIALAVDAAGRLYVADGSSARVLVFAPDDRFLHQWDRASGTAPALSFPQALAVDPRGVVYVADGPRLQTLGPRPAR